MRLAICDSGEYAGEVNLAIDTVELESLAQRGDDAPIFSSVIGSKKQVFFAIEGVGTESAPGHVGIDLNAANADGAGKTFTIAAE